MDFGDLASSPAGFAGSAIAAIITAAALIRKFLLSDKVQSATAQGNVDVIASLRNYADLAEARAQKAEERADTAYRERNEAFAQIGALQEQVRQLTNQVYELRKQLDNAKLLP